MKKKIKITSVDDAVPIPVRHKAVVPLKKLEKGQSIAFPLVHRNNTASYASVLKKKYGMEYTIRKINETEARVWRVK